MAETVIDIQGLQKTYREGWVRRRTIEALRGVSFDVRQGEIFGLLGPNGAGKTTLIKILLGIVRRSQGTAMLLGRPAGTREVRRRIGYLPESHQIPRHLTGNTALEYYGELSGLSVSEVRSRRPELLELVSLSEWGTTSVRKYSKGMRQRLGLAQAILHQPELVILDEPTDGVDPVGRARIREVLRDIRDRGTTVFINSHLLQEVELVCDRVAILMGGRVRQVGRVDELTDVLEGAAPVRIVVAGPAGAVDEGLAEFIAQTNADRLPEVEPLVDGRVRVQLDAVEQQQVDRLIDCWRTRGVSLLSLDRQRPTLEEAFLRLVQSEAE